MTTDDICRACPYLLEMERQYRRRRCIVRVLSVLFVAQMAIGVTALVWAQPLQDLVAASERAALERRLTRLEDATLDARVRVIESDLSAIKWLLSAVISVALVQLAALVAGWRKVTAPSPQVIGELQALVPKLQAQQREFEALIERYSHGTGTPPPTV